MFIFHVLGKIIPTVTHSIIFQRGRAKNHRPALEAPILLRSNLSESTSPIHGADGAGHDGCSNQPACTEQGLAFRNHCWPSQALQKSQRVTALQKSSCFLGILVTLNSFWKWFHWNIFKVSDLWVTRPVIRFTICAIIFFSGRMAPCQYLEYLDLQDVGPDQRYQRCQSPLVFSLVFRGC